MPLRLPSLQVTGTAGRDTQGQRSKAVTEMETTDREGACKAPSKQLLKCSEKSQLGIGRDLDGVIEKKQKNNETALCRNISLTNRMLYRQAPLHTNRDGLITVLGENQCKTVAYI